MRISDGSSASCGRRAWLSTVAQTTPGAAGETARPMRPTSAPAGKPEPSTVTRAHVAPPSSERQMAEPGPASRKSQARRRARPRRGVEAVRIRGVEDEVDGAGVGLARGVEGERPRRAAVAGDEDAALASGGVERPDGGDPGRVGVRRVEADAADVVAVVEPEVRPRLAAVGALVDAGAGVGRAAGVALARPGPDRRAVALGVAPVHGDVAHRHAGLLVEERLEAGARRSGSPTARQRRRRRRRSSGRRACLRCRPRARS